LEVGRFIAHNSGLLLLLAPWKRIPHFVTDPFVYKSEGSQTSSGLLHRAILHEQEAWNKLVGLYGPVLYRWCRRWGLQPKDAENVGQEIFVRVLQGLPRFRRDAAGSFRSWLHCIARNCYVDHMRRQQRLPAVGAGGSEAFTQLNQLGENLAKDDEATAHEDNALLYQQAVRLIQSEFSDRDWNIFMQLVMEDRPAAEVAAMSGVTPNIVYLTKSRILRRLREEFSELLQF
jgi:RNA polymerase sigma-70 factor (ECF subfamily)